MELSLVTDGLKHSTTVAMNLSSALASRSVSHLVFQAVVRYEIFSPCVPCLILRESVHQLEDSSLPLFLSSLTLAQSKLGGRQVPAIESKERHE